jgi:hypothetical protein
VRYFSGFDGGGPCGPYLPEVAGDRVRFRYGVFDTMKALYPDCDIPPGDISGHHNGHILPDGSVTLSLLGGTEYLIHLANGKCYRIC